MSIPAELTREHVLMAIAELNAGVSHGFGTPRGYELLYEGKRYPPKAVVGLACRHLTGNALSPGEFRSGVQRGQAVYVLRNLGFTVEPISNNRSTIPRGDERLTTSNWTREEIQLLVDDYFAMLSAELAGQRYKKSEYRNALARKVNGRSDGSIEFKHQNVSAVLAERGLPYIEGYKPRTNYQELLATEVKAYIERHPGFLDSLANSPIINPEDATPPGNHDLENAIEGPPEKIILPMPSQKPWLSRQGYKINFVQRDAANRRLGALAAR